MSANILIGLDLQDKGSSKLDKFAGKIKTLGTVSTQAGEKLTNAFANAVMFKSLDQILKSIEASTLAVHDFTIELAELSQLANGMSSQGLTNASKEFRLLATSAQQSSQQIAKASTEYIKMGKSTSEALKLLPITMDLITAGGDDVTSTLETVSTAMNAYGLNADKASWAMNRMQAAANASMTDFQGISEGFKEVGPLAAEVGISFDEILTLLGQMSNAGIKGERGGTALKNTITNLMRPSEAVAKTMKGLNLEGMSFMDLLKKIGENNTVKEQLATLDLRAIGPVLYMNKHLQQYDEMKKAIETNGKIVQKMAEAKQKAFGMELDQAKKLTQEYGQNLFAALQQVGGKDPLERINNSLTAMNRELINNPQNVKLLADGLTIIGDGLAFIVRNAETLGALFGSAVIYKGVQFLATSFTVAKKEMELLYYNWNLNQKAEIAYENTSAGQRELRALQEQANASNRAAMAEAEALATEKSIQQRTVLWENLQKEAATNEVLAASINGVTFNTFDEIRAKALLTVETLKAEKAQIMATISNDDYRTSVLSVAQSERVAAIEKEIASAKVVAATERQAVVVSTLSKEMQMAEIQSTRLKNSLALLGNANVWLVLATVVGGLVVHFQGLQREIRETNRLMDQMDNDSKMHKQTIAKQMMDVVRMNRNELATAQYQKIGVRVERDDLQSKLKNKTVPLKDLNATIDRVASLNERLKKLDEVITKNTLTYGIDTNAITGSLVGNGSIYAPFKDFMEVLKSNRIDARTFLLKEGLKETGGTGVFSASLEQLNKIIEKFYREDNLPENKYGPDQTNLKVTGGFDGSGKGKKAKGAGEETLHKDLPYLGDMYPRDLMLEQKLISVKFFDEFERYHNDSKISYKDSKELSEKLVEQTKENKDANLDRLNSFAQKELSALGKTPDNLDFKKFVEYFDSFSPRINAISNFDFADKETKNTAMGSQDSLESGAVDAFKKSISDLTDSLNKAKLVLGVEFYPSRKTVKGGFNDLESTYQLAMRNPKITQDHKEQITNEYQSTVFDRKKNDALADAANYQKAYESAATALETIWDAQDKRMQDRHDTEMSNLQEESDLAISLAGDNAIRKQKVEQDYAKKKSDLAKKQHEESVAFAKKQKALAMIQATISLAQAELGVAAAQFGGITSKAIAMAAMGALGAVQIGTIASQKYDSGSHGVVKSNGQGNSDLIPAYLSEGEIVTRKKDVEELGGEEGFKQALQTARGRTNQGSQQIFHIGQLYGSEQYVRQLFKQMQKEVETWQY